MNQDQDSTPEIPTDNNGLVAALPVVTESSEAELDVVEAVVADAAVEAVLEDEQIASTPYPDVPTPFENKNVTQEYDHVKQGSAGIKVNVEEEYIPHAALPIEDIIHIFDKVPEVSDQDSELAREYFKNIEVGTQSIPLVNRFEATLNRVDSDYRQYLQTEKGKVGYSSPKFGEKDVAKVSGERAILRTRALLGKGSIIAIPLWHSGFWLTITTPSESAFLELRRRLMEDKVRLGRDTQGLIFSNTQSYTTGWLLDMVLDHFYDCTLKVQSDIRQRIATPDLPVLFWGLACAIWPNGYQYSRSILTDAGIKSKEIITGKIDVAKLMWVDNASFTPAQKAHMSNRTSSSMTNDSVDKYLDDFPLRKGRTVEINENVKVTLNVPSAEDFVKSGQRWISDIVSMVDRIFTSDVTHADSRRLAIDENARATAIRQFGHWIESVTVEDIEHKDKDTVSGILEVFSEDKVIRNKVAEEIAKFTDEVTVAVIAIPESTGKETGLPRYPRLIPVDVTAVFFTLLMQRINRILNS